MLTAARKLSHEPAQQLNSERDKITSNEPPIPTRRRNIHNRRALHLRRHEMVHRALRHLHRRREVRRDDPRPQRRVEVPDRLELVHHPRAVDHVVEMAVLRRRFRKQIVERRLGCNVAFDCERALCRVAGSDLCAEVGERRGFDVAGDDVGAFGEEALGDGAAYLIIRERL